MSLKAFPLLYVNLVGEMIYILEQRLKQMDQEKSLKVIKDIVNAVFSKEQLDDVFHPRPIPTRSILRKTFDALAHTSCMKLAESSMDKLFDLMTMTSKFQTLGIIYPEQILMVAVNHLRGIKQLIGIKYDSGCIANVHLRLLALYRPTASWEWSMIRNDLLAYYQDCKIKISLLMRQGRQLDDGTFNLHFSNEPFWLKPGDTIPGVINYYDVDGNVYKREEPEDIRWTTKPRTFGFLKFHDNFDLEQEERSTHLGENMFSAASTFPNSNSSNKSEPVPLQGDEMKLLESIFGGMTKSKENDSTFDLIGLNVFENEEEEDESVQTYISEINSNIGNKIKKIDAARNKKSLDAIMNELNFDERPVTRASRKPRGADILNMMDEVATRPYTAQQNKTLYEQRSRPLTRDASSRVTSSLTQSRQPSAKSRTSSSGPSGRTETSNPISRSPSMNLNMQHVATPQWSTIYG